MNRLIFALSLLILVFLLASCGESDKTSEAAQAIKQPQKTQIQPAPEPLNARPQTDASQTSTSVPAESNPSIVQFSANDIYGRPRNSDEWLGKQPTIINIWGTWCPPCRREIPDLVRLYNEYNNKGIEILGMAVNDKPHKVEKFAIENKMTWVMMMGERNHMNILAVTSGVPTTIFFNRDGKEVQRFVGPRSYDVFKEAFEAIL